MKPQTEAEQKLDAFYCYLERRFPDSFGKEFLVFHGRKNGAKALDTFWQKLCEAHALDKKYIELSDSERVSLEEIIKTRASRRQFFKRSMGIAMAVLGGVTLLNTASGIAEEENKPSWNGVKQGMGSVPVLLTEAVLSLAGVFVYQQGKDSKNHEISDLIQNGDEKGIEKLVEALDKIFAPLLREVKATRPFGARIAPKNVNDRGNGRDLSLH